MKKVKLFTTIASLCLAVALMAFGVYAATQVDISITGNVSFSAAANVKATVTLSDTAENVATGYTAVVNKELYKTGEDANEIKNTGSHDFGDMVFTATSTNASIVYSYTVTIKNDAAATDEYKVLNVVVTESLNDEAQLNVDGYTVAISGELANGGTVAQGASATYTVTLTINPNISVSKADIGSAITLTMTK